MCDVLGSEATTILRNAYALSGIPIIFRGTQIPYIFSGTSMPNSFMPLRMVTATHWEIWSRKMRFRSSVSLKMGVSW